MKSSQPSTKALRSSTELVYTAALVEEPKNQPALLPEWVRLPKSGKLCPWTGLSRSTLNALILGSNPPVKSVSLKKRYAIRGTRLIHLQSLLDYIEGVAAAQRSIEPSSSENSATNS